MSGRFVTSAELVHELEARATREEPCALAFDADGTLWSGDVGDDVFRFAIAQRRLLDDVRDALERAAYACGFEVFPDVNETAARLFEHYVAGRYPEREMCELMTWCYAGLSVEEMRALAIEALAAARHADRLHEELRPILQCAQAHGLRAIIISASPRIPVEQAAKSWGFCATDVVASTPCLKDGVIAACMAEPIPYAIGKVTAGRALLGPTHWLASFGDNVFDLEMMREAELGVAVRPKPRLEARLDEVPGVLRLDWDARASRGEPPR